MTRLIEIHDFKAYAGTPPLRLLARKLAGALEPVSWLGLPPKLIFTVDYPGGHKVVSDPVEVYRLRKAHPDATVRVDRVN